MVAFCSFRYTAVLYSRWPTNYFSNIRWISELHSCFRLKQLNNLIVNKLSFLQILALIGVLDFGRLFFAAMIWRLFTSDVGLNFENSRFLLRDFYKCTKGIYSCLLRLSSFLNLYLHTYVWIFLSTLVCKHSRSFENKYLCALPGILADQQNCHSHVFPSGVNVNFTASFLYLAQFF